MRCAAARVCEQVLSRHFGMLPRSVRRASVLCLGQMTIHWRGLGATVDDPDAAAAVSAAALATTAAKEEHDGYSGDKSEAGSSGDEAVSSSMRAILPSLQRMVVPTPTNFTVAELVARGGSELSSLPAAGSADGGPADGADVAGLGGCVDADDESWL